MDSHVLEVIAAEGRHPALPEHLPSELSVFPTERLEEAAEGCQIAVMAASSAGARSLARLVAGALPEARLVVSVAKGLEESTGLRPSQVYSDEIPGASVVAVGGPCLASEMARALHTVAVWACADEGAARAAGEPFDNHHYRVSYTDDIVGVEYCAVVKNVAAIGLGLLDGLGKPLGEDYKNAKSALFAKALNELVALVVAVGGRQETALGLAGVGDAMVTSLGGRNRLYGELVGEGADPKLALEEMIERGMTVEGVDSAKHVHRLAGEFGLELPFHSTVHRTLLEGGDPRELLEVLS
jgi:glycerol-3-phosphate dehydrogenase (NAD(P)+)